MGQIGQPQPGHFDPPESPAECLVKLPSNLKDGTPTFSQVAKAKNTERMISRRNNKRLVLKNRFPRFDVASCHEKATHLQIELQRCWGGWQIKNHRFAWPLAHQVISVHCSVENKSKCYWECKQILFGHLDPKLSECWDRVCEQMPLPDSQMTTQR